MIETMATHDFEALETFLASDRVAENCMTLSQLDGFLTGIAVGPEFIRPSEWLPIVWGDDGPAFADLDEANAMMGSIMLRYNQILRQIDDDAVDPIFSAEPDGAVTPRAWASGFLTAAGLRVKAWEPLMKSQTDGVLLFPILSLGSDEHGKSLIGLNSEESEEMLVEAPAVIPGCVKAIADFWRQRQQPMTSMTDFGEAATPAARARNSNGAVADRAPTEAKKESVPSDPVASLPTLSELDYSPEALIAALREDQLSRTGIAVATLYAGEIESDILAVVERARREDLDDASARLFLRGIHVLGGRRLTTAYRSFLAFLRESGPERTDNLLGDAVGTTLARILAGLFDGDPGPLETLITDKSVDEFVRNDALLAFAFLTFDGRIKGAYAEEFLEHLEKENAGSTGDSMFWHGWMLAVGLLGIKRLTPRVDAAFREGRIPQWAAVESDFFELLNAAQDRPADRSRFEDEGLGYIEDTLEALARLDFEPDWMSEGHDFEADLTDVTDGLSSKMLSEWPGPSMPEHNPYRDVGRNDACPCGSGKKFKRCCMPQ
jgi:uncharacterized protein